MQEKNLNCRFWASCSFISNFKRINLYNFQVLIICRLVLELPSSISSEVMMNGDPDFEYLYLEFSSHRESLTRSHSEIAQTFNKHRT